MRFRFEGNSFFDDGLPWKEHNHFQFFPNIITKLIHYTIGKMSSY